MHQATDALAIICEHAPLEYLSFVEGFGALSYKILRCEWDLSELHIFLEIKQVTCMNFSFKLSSLPLV